MGANLKFHVITLLITCIVYSISILKHKSNNTITKKHWLLFSCRLLCTNHSSYPRVVCYVPDPVTIHMSLYLFMLMLKATGNG